MSSGGLVTKQFLWHDPDYGFLWFGCFPNCQPCSFASYLVNFQKIPFCSMIAYPDGCSLRSSNEGLTIVSDCFYFGFICLSLFPMKRASQWQRPYLLFVLATMSCIVLSKPQTSTFLLSQHLSGAEEGRGIFKACWMKKEWAKHSIGIIWLRALTRWNHTVNLVITYLITVF